MAPIRKGCPSSPCVALRIGPTAHRLSAAIFAIELRSAGDSAAARAFPPAALPFTFGSFMVVPRPDLLLALCMHLAILQAYIQLMLAFTLAVKHNGQHEPTAHSKARPDPR